MSSVDSTHRLSCLAEFAIPQAYRITECSEEKMSEDQISEGMKKSENQLQTMKKIIPLSKDILEGLIFIMYKASKGVSSFIKDIPIASKDSVVLDVGCGVGDDTIALLAKGWAVHAVDNHPGVIKIFNENLNQCPNKSNCKLFKDNIVDLTLKPNTYDFVIGYDVLAYIPSKFLIETLKKIYQALLPKGIFAGTLLVTENVTVQDHNALATIQAPNVYTYSYKLISGFLRLVGFRIEACALNSLIPSNDDFPAKQLHFVARKIV